MILYKKGNNLKDIDLKVEGINYYKRGSDTEYESNM